MEGKGFRDRTPEFASRNTVIVGISCDTPAENLAFRVKFDFPYDLLCDESRTVSQVYGAADAADTQYPAR
ncbi:MAG: peroxiredoxin, partial [Rhodospirillaceae bacterium]|nr:peroxiredoxin [Rhodospirillaceae bacterium]